MVHGIVLSLRTSIELVYFFKFFFFNDTATTEIYTLSLHDALPILSGNGAFRSRRSRRPRSPTKRGGMSTAGSWLGNRAPERSSAHRRCGWRHDRAAAVRNERGLRLRRLGGRHQPLYLAAIAHPIAHRRAAAAAGSARIPLYRIVLSGSRRGVARSAARVRARRGLWRHRRRDVGFGRFGHAAEWRGDCAGLGVQPLGHFRSFQRVLSGQRSRIIARTVRRRLFHSRRDRSAVAHNARIDVSDVTAEPARASGGVGERIAAPATRRATGRARTGHAPFRQRTSIIQGWSPLRFAAAHESEFGP